MFRRLWWCIYVLDRRLALETGRPFVIQDVNVDTTLPLKVDDNWLSMHLEDSRPPTLFPTETQNEAGSDSITPIDYLIVMIRYSKVVGQVWEALYGANVTELASAPLVIEYLETLLSRFQEEVPLELVYHDNQSFEKQKGNVPWWQTKQKLLIYMVCTECKTHTSSLNENKAYKVAATFDSQTNVEEVT